MSHRALQIGVALAVASALALSGAACAQDGLWRTRTQIYGWALSPTADAVSDMPELSPRPHVSHGEFAARYGRFGLWSDAILSPGLSERVLLDADTGVRPQGMAWTVAGAYAAVETSRVDVYTLAGLRQLRTDPGLDGRALGFTPAASLNRSDAWDAILGVRGRVKLGEGRWFAPYYVDVGTGQSDFTWQAFGGIGYAFPWGEIVGTWRHLDYNFASGSRIRDLTFSGPSISFGFRW